MLTAVKCRMRKTEIQKFFLVSHINMYYVQKDVLCSERCIMFRKIYYVQEARKHKLINIIDNALHQI